MNYQRQRRYHEQLLGRHLAIYDEPWGGADKVFVRLLSMKWGKLREMARVAGLGPWERRPSHTDLACALISWMGDLGERRTAVRKQLFLWPAEEVRAQYGRG